MLNVTCFILISFRACSAVAALTSAEYNFATKVKSVVGLTYGEWPKGLNWIVTDKFMTLTAAQPAADTATPHPIAFLQFTSGSTSEPKGVVISQSNLAHNLNLIITGICCD